MFLSKDQSGFEAGQKCTGVTQNTQRTHAHYHSHTPHSRTHRLVSVLPSRLSSGHNSMQKTLQFSCGISVTVTPELLQPKKNHTKRRERGSGSLEVNYIPKRMAWYNTLLLLSYTHARMAGGHAGRAIPRLTAEANLLADNGQRCKAAGRTA